MPVAEPFERGAVWATEGRTRGGACIQLVSAPGWGRILAWDPHGKLKNWKSEKLNADRTCRDSRFSGFQVFTCPQFHVAEEGAILNGSLRAELLFPRNRKNR
jgi:hypothetical protein